MAEWRDIELKGMRWIVSDEGAVKISPHTHTFTRVRDGKTQTLTTTYVERLVPAHVNHSGYLEVCARKENRRVKVAVHRLVGFAFVDGYEEGLSINHIDGNKLNNNATNLEWVSLSQNTKHQWAIGLVDIRGDNSPTKKLTSKQVVYIRKLLAKGISAYELSIIAGVSHSLIDHIRHGRRWPTVTNREPVRPSQLHLPQGAIEEPKPDDAANHRLIELGHQDACDL
jgi:hypothetical protein